MNAPIILFVYKRLNTLINCINSLKDNNLSRLSDLYIYSDAAANDSDIEKVDAVRSFIDTVSGFKSITVIRAVKNKGLAFSIIHGVTEVLKVHRRAIVLEDDLVVSANFLHFMNQCLDFYEDEEKVMSVSGFSLPIQLPKNYPCDVYFTKRVFSWGWATWASKWKDIDWEISDYSVFSSHQKNWKHFNRMGSDLSSMLQKQMNGKINSWAIRWYYHQFKHQLFTVFPIQSKVVNDGFNADATHSGLTRKRYRSHIRNTDQVDFKLCKTIEINQKIIKQFISHFSLPVRVYYKISDTVNKILHGN